MKLLILAAAVAASFSAHCGEIAEAYSKIAHPSVSLTNLSPGPLMMTNHGITEIGMERGWCYGSCPIYTLVLRNDGTFSYTGVKFVQRVGSFTGTVPVYSFNQLAQYIKDSGYMELQDGYGEIGDDLDTVYTTVVMKGKRKVVMNHGSTGPSKLWGVQQLIDLILANEATWKAR
jgi:hypothetical protein